MRAPYFVLQVCLNGHLVKAHFRGELGELHQTTIRGLDQYCSRCGSKTIAHCLSCRREIRDESVEEILSAIPTPIQLPSFCVGCGTPYPWMQQKLDIISRLIDQAEIDKQEAQDLKNMLPSIVHETSETPRAIERLKRFLASAAPPIRDAFISKSVELGLEFGLRIVGMK